MMIKSRMNFYNWTTLENGAGAIKLSITIIITAHQTVLRQLIII